MQELSYPFEKRVPELATTIEVAPGILWLRMPLPWVLNHVNLWLLKDDKDWCVIDTGVAWSTIQEIWFKVLKEYPLSRQIVTHHHPDHIGLAGWLEQKTGAPLWATQAEYLTTLAYVNEIGNYSIHAMTELFQSHGLNDKRLNALKERGCTYQKWVPTVPLTYQRIFDNDIIKIGKYKWRVIVGYGHAMEHASFYCDALKVLISGDMLLPSISTNILVMPANPMGNPLNNFLDSIRRYRELPEDTLVLPSHGRPFIGIHSRVDQLEKHHQMRCDVLLSACSTPLTACDALPILFDREIDDAHQCIFAMGESIAHLNYLEELKKLERIEKNNLIRFISV